MKMLKAAIIGGTGYGAVELIRLLHGHPFVELEVVVANSLAGNDLPNIFPHFTSVIDSSLAHLDVEEICKKVDVVFFATPSGISKEIVPAFLENGVACIDLSGDFRLKSGDQYEKWYAHSQPEDQYLEKAVYGLTEIFMEEIKKSNFIANPGCYPTATQLAVIPALKSNLIDRNTIIVDAKSGVSGAGRGLSIGTHYGEINENLKAYKLGIHQHIPEIEQTLGHFSPTPLTITFQTHLVPMTRGIMCTIYVDLIDYKTTREVLELYEDFYKDHPFVRIRKEGNLPATKEVYSSNFCDIGLYADERTGKLIIVSVIDNLVKGAAGQAVQNLNVMNGWDVRTGIMNVPIYP